MEISYKNFNKRIVIEKLNIVTTENNFDTEEWVDFATLWSSINNLYGREFWAAKAINKEDTVVFTVRYSKKISAINKENYRIKFKDKIFNIIFIDNVKYENKFIKIKAIGGDINE
ncbi:head-tail adaptor protein [Clostridium sp. K25]|uniref:phage head closure protein n=1 Tax=Clostridium TaxID=1485 RepID=UPI0004DAC779|nr:MULTISPECIES: phage head closure protein [Clostridium]KEI09298.1 head-tail adaptor protein [Clostridium sp. K25]KEI12619.1 head-tail adaptor protein [Clostridium novyi B str. NCTC 9691]